MRSRIGFCGFNRGTLYFETIIIGNSFQKKSQILSFYWEIELLLLIHLH
jgi:hypothetical protein